MPGPQPVCPGLCPSYLCRKPYCPRTSRRGSPHPQPRPRRDGPANQPTQGASPMPRHTLAQMRFKDWFPPGRLTIPKINPYWGSPKLPYRRTNFPEGFWASIFHSGKQEEKLVSHGVPMEAPPPPNDNGAVCSGGKLRDLRKICARARACSGEDFMTSYC